VRRNLTLDAGLRFYHDPPQYDPRGQLTSFTPSAYSGADAPLLLSPGLDAAGKKSAIDPLNGPAYWVGLIGTFAPWVAIPSTVW